MPKHTPDEDYDENTGIGIYGDGTETQDSPKDKHTPGPWTYSKIGGTITAYNTIEKDKFTTEEDMEAYGGYMVAESAFNPHNAHLIAAAPCLLEAAKIINIWERKHHNWLTYDVGEDQAAIEINDLLKIVRTAIAKAEGNPA